jgi:hypothetical protein
VADESLYYNISNHGYFVDTTYENICGCIDFSIHQTMCLDPIGSAKTTWPLELEKESWKIIYPMAVFNIMLQVGVKRY